MEPENEKDPGNQEGRWKELEQKKQKDEDQML